MMTLNGANHAAVGEKWLEDRVAGKNYKKGETPYEEWRFNHALRNLAKIGLGRES